MEPPKVVFVENFARVTQQTRKKKERIVEPTNIVEVE
jgi:hypothetical protein